MAPKWTEVQTSDLFECLYKHNTNTSLSIYIIALIVKRGCLQPMYCTNICTKVASSGLNLIWKKKTWKKFQCSHYQRKLSLWKLHPPPKKKNLIWATFTWNVNKACGSLWAVKLRINSQMSTASHTWFSWSPMFCGWCHIWHVHKCSRFGPIYWSLSFKIFYTNSKSKQMKEFQWIEMEAQTGLKSGT